MIAIIQCAGSKHDGGSFRTRDGRKVRFVGDPAIAPPSQECFYAHPDDLADDGVTWRDKLAEYNRMPGNNPLGLLRAGELYENVVYGRLIERFGWHGTYILSAGWSLIGASFLTPYYDITFNAVKPPDRYKRRKKGERYLDFNMLPGGTDETVVSFVSDKYIPLLSELTGNYKGRRVVFYSTATRPQVTGCMLEKFSGVRSTNWQYDCANAFLNGTIAFPD
jgi:hypothetical protein